MTPYTELLSTNLNDPNGPGNLEAESLTGYQI